MLTLHGGPSSTIAFIRSTFWIPKIRQAVKPVLRSCVTCLKVTGRFYRPPDTPPLPSTKMPSIHSMWCRLHRCTSLQIDTRTILKAYVCLSTCAVTRAVHLEVVTDMTAESFLLAFRRFAGRRFQPDHMISDNALTFVSGAEMIRTILDSTAVTSYLAIRNVQWTFIPKRAPWFGGFYERLIGITKNALEKTLGQF